MSLKANEGIPNAELERLVDNIHFNEIIAPGECSHELSIQSSYDGRHRSAGFAGSIPSLEESLYQTKRTDLCRDHQSPGGNCQSRLHLGLSGRDTLRADQWCHEARARIRRIAAGSTRC